MPDLAGPNHRSSGLLEEQDVTPLHLPERRALAFRKASLDGLRAVEYVLEERLDEYTEVQANLIRGGGVKPREELVPERVRGDGVSDSVNRIRHIGLLQASSPLR